MSAPAPVALLCPLMLLLMGSSPRVWIIRSWLVLCRYCSTVGLLLYLPMALCLPKKDSRGSWQYRSLRRNLTPGKASNFGAISVNANTAFRKSEPLYMHVYAQNHVCSISTPHSPVIFKPSCVWALRSNFSLSAGVPGSCLTYASQSSMYRRKTSLSHCMWYNSRLSMSLPCMHECWCMPFIAPWISWHLHSSKGFLLFRPSQVALTFRQSKNPSESSQNWLIAVVSASALELVRWICLRTTDTVLLSAYNIIMQWTWCLHFQLRTIIIANSKYAYLCSQVHPYLWIGCKEDVLSSDLGSIQSRWAAGLLIFLNQMFPKYIAAIVLNTSWMFDMGGFECMWLVYLYTAYVYALIRVYES